MLHAPNSLLFSSSILTLVSIALVCAVACAAVLAFLLKTGLAWRLATDIPNERSLHVRPTPRVGGWGVIPVAVVAILLVAPSLWLIALGAAFLAAVSQIDDRRGLPARVRFAAHFVAVLALIVGYPAPIPWWCAAILAFLLLWLVNLYNFMDGADGLAGGMALFGFGGYALAAFAGPQPMLPLSWACVAVAGAAAGFLLFNFHPAKIFLGDAGSIPTGFLAGALGYWGWRGGAWPIWFPALVFAPFIGDASVTLIRRLLRGEKFWQAHREHYYQRMVRLGTGHAVTALSWYLVICVGIVIALWALGRSPAQQWGIVAGWAVVLVLMGAAIDVRWRSFQSLTSQSEVDADAPQ
ncbi:MAG: glycosyltransferase family 4 protein [Paraburkholderia tropica]|jgi:UDP-N-acetylmuramyl pentapeptide phosphotransferase/UDP-N-acetylglucosamine-1-phosphate transferase|uniref:UDP-N-acetylmuramyl pentapeptide phosphotransferase/UDP-N-acetylglucosamine-1-phosphate transferase n=1 Tax=Paraburkholderia tropica TaxID=92647 RepID=A0ABX5MQ96_9BURK|nr:MULTISPECIES: glycosyltransferase family 4 protein [Paraburkholderia]PXX16211.1 UDP-N-acetylmuramyl pentapeptide phosphotransferase/UDP-N-acetylglucosamine-1-phosphate transferase [Paraburkholderia tropica]PZW82603.1 UDP-N-acetylmuramyl pentapeptide phosphotransferase/UDP-N-acetylglucosamine-1-phosphate transferase [Paraburkholderia tropica]